MNDRRRPSESYASGIARFAALVDWTGSTRTSLRRRSRGGRAEDVRALHGTCSRTRTRAISRWPTTSCQQAGQLSGCRTAFRPSSSTGQKGIVTLNAGPSPIRVYVWSALELVRDPLLRRWGRQGHADGDGAGERGLHSARHGTGEGNPSEAVVTLALVAILRAGPTLGIRAGPERTEAILRGPSHAQAKTRGPALIELRETDGGPTLHAVILTEGRAARGGRRAELFAPGAVIWPPDGIEIRTVHLGPTQARAVPVRQGAEIHVSAPATPALAAAVRVRQGSNVCRVPRVDGDPHGERRPGDRTGRDHRSDRNHHSRVRTDSRGAALPAAKAGAAVAVSLSRCKSWRSRYASSRTETDYRRRQGSRRRSRQGARRGGQPRVEDYAPAAPVAIQNEAVRSVSRACCSTGPVMNRRGGNPIDPEQARRSCSPRIGPGSVVSAGQSFESDRS